MCVSEWGVKLKTFAPNRKKEEEDDDEQILQILNRLAKFFSNRNFKTYTHNIDLFLKS